MKKIYFAPKTTIVKVELQQMIAASGTGSFSDGTDPVVINEGDATGSGLSRRGSLWDEEE